MPSELFLHHQENFQAKAIGTLSGMELKKSSHLWANWMAFPPTPVKQSIMVSPIQRNAWCLAIGSGVTENHPSSSILIPSSNLENKVYLWHQYLAMFEENSSNICSLWRSAQNKAKPNFNSIWSTSRKLESKKQHKVSISSYPNYFSKNTAHAQAIPTL